jgi:DNA-binding transcriptional ArsR family regulator
MYSVAMSLLPLRGESSTEPGEPRVLGLAGEDADEAFDVLSSSTTREVLSMVYEQPSTPAEIRDEVGTSLQNVHYHVDKLEDADLIEAAGTGYSEKGTEMTIYAPTSEAIVLFAGKESDRSRFRQMLGRVFGIVLALAAGTVLYDRFLVDRAGRQIGTYSGGPGGDGGDGAATTTEEGGQVGIMDVNESGTPTPETTQTTLTTTAAGDGGSEATEASRTATAEATRTATEQQAATTADVTREMAAQADTRTPAEFVMGALADPAIAFLLGGVFALAVGTAVWYATR